MLAEYAVSQKGSGVVASLAVATTSEATSRKRGRPKLKKNVEERRRDAVERATDLSDSYAAPISGWVDPSERAKYLWHTFGTRRILDEAENIINTKLSTFDAMIVVNIANALKADGEERERLFNRVFGKVPDKVVSINLNIDADPEALSERAMALLSKL